MNNKKKMSRFKKRSSIKNQNKEENFFYNIKVYIRDYNVYLASKTIRQKLYENLF